MPDSSTESARPPLPRASSASSRGVSSPCFTLPLNSYRSTRSPTNFNRARATSPSISAGWWNGIWSGALASSAPAKDHYEAATDFWLVMREIMERRFRWNLRQVLASVAETSRALETGSRPGSGAQAEKRAFINGRLEGMRAFFAIVDSSIGAFTQGQSVAPQEMQKVIQFAAKQTVKRR